MRVFFALLVLALVVGMVCSDEAVRSDGRPLKGTLSLEKTGQLRFTPTDKRASAPEELSEIRLEGGPAPLFRSAPGKVLRLPGGQHISGVFLGLEKNALLLRTAWSERLAVPRGSPVALTHQPGWRPVFAEDFAGKLSGWTVQGEPVTKSGTTTLVRTGQSLAWSPTSPLASGRIGVNFREEGMISGARWWVETRFAIKGGERLVRVLVAGGESLAVEAGGLAGTAQTVARAAGWRRLVIDFSGGAMRIRCDDSVLWYTLAQGPGGPLRQAKLVCAAPNKPGAVRGSVAFADFVVERSVAEQRRPPGEPDQDELWLAGGDQVFGRVMRADRQGVELKSRSGTRRFAWSALRGWFLKREKPAASATGRGPAVRLWLRSGLGPTPDVLEGTLAALNTRHVTIRHPLLGELVIPRASVARLRKLGE